MKLMFRRAYHLSVIMSTLPYFSAALAIAKCVLNESLATESVQNKRAGSVIPALRFHSKTPLPPDSVSQPMLGNWK